MVASITADLHANVYGNPQAAAEASRDALRIMVGAGLLTCALWPLLTFAASPGIVLFCCSLLILPRVLSLEIDHCYAFLRHSSSTTHQGAPRWLISAWSWPPS